MKQAAFVGLIKIEFPTHTLRLCDGGAFSWDSQSWASKDAVFGTVGAMSEFEEGVGGEVPSFSLTFLPPAETAPAALSQPGFQRSRVRVWLARYDTASGAIIGTPDQQFDGMIDRTRLVVGKSKRALEQEIVGKGERFFARNLGNSLNPSYHKSIWPGETGEDQATGLGRAVAWGVESPAPAMVAAGSGGGAGAAWRAQNVNYL